MYNVERYLDRCMASALGQTYRDLDIILVDDGATDSSGRMCDAYAEKDSRVQVVHRPNGGLLMFVDSDDWLDPDTVEVCVRYFVEDPELDCVLFPYLREFADRSRPVEPFGQEVCQFDAGEVRTRILRRLVGAVGEERRRADSLSDLNPPWGRMMKTACVSGLRFVNGREIGSAEDLWFNIEMFLGVRKALYTPAVHYHYFKENQTSIVHSYNDRLFATRLNLYSLIADFIAEHRLGKDFQEALEGRQALEILSLARNIMNAALPLSKKYSLMRDLLDSSDVRRWMRGLSLRDLSPIWKVYFGACKYRLPLVVIGMTYAAERLRAYLR